MGKYQRAEDESRNLAINSKLSGPADFKLKESKCGYVHRLSNWHPLNKKKYINIEDQCTVNLRTEYKSDEFPIL